jgi:hypothetical protein
LISVAVRSILCWPVDQSQILALDPLPSGQFLEFLECRSEFLDAPGEHLSQKQIKDLKAKQAVAAKKLDEMGKSSSSAWDDSKEGFSNAYKDLAQSAEKAAAEFK